MKDIPESYRSLEDLIALSRQVAEEASRMMEEAREARLEEARALAGSSWGDMATSHSGRMEQLKHPTPEIRQAALRLISELGPRTAEFLIQCERLAFTDPAPAVRVDALLCLAGLQRDTHDRRLGSLLAQLVRDVSQARDIRKAAYLTLLTIFSRLESYRPIAENDTQFPEGIEWSFVDTFLL
jgi:hypothetical protein